MILILILKMMTNHMKQASDNSTMNSDDNLSDGSDQMEEDQQQHFGVPEIDNIDEDDSSNGEEGVGGDEVEKTYQFS